MSCLAIRSIEIQPTGGCMCLVRQVSFTYLIVMIVIIDSTAFIFLSSTWCMHSYGFDFINENQVAMLSSDVTTRGYLPASEKRLTMPLHWLLYIVRVKKTGACRSLCADVVTSSSRRALCREWFVSLGMSVPSRLIRGSRRSVWKDSKPRKTF